MLRTLQNDALIDNLPIAGPFHVAWVYDSSVPEVRGYVDGVHTDTFPQSAPINLVGTSADFRVLRYSSSSRPGTVMDDFRFYRRAIDQAEIHSWVAACAGGVGTTYCSPAVANSTGVPATIGASGSAVVASNNLTLHAQDLPLSSFGYFLTSASQGFVQQPGGSQGDLCLGGAIGRYVGSGQVQKSGATGEFSLQVDLTQHPTPTGFVAVSAGEAWNFQCWYRDSIGGVAGSNFTDAIEVGFL